jgi:hypothetical protein
VVHLMNSQVVKSYQFFQILPSKIDDDDDEDQWRYSPDRALASLTGFMIVYSTMWGYQFHDQPVLDTLIQPSETSSSNYQRLSWRSRERNTGEKWQLNFADEHLSCS